jgi:hypothetical protein
MWNKIVIHIGTVKCRFLNLPETAAKMVNIILVRKPLAKFITGRLRARCTIEMYLNMYFSWFICVTRLLLIKGAIFYP